MEQLTTDDIQQARESVQRIVDAVVRGELGAGAVSRVVVSVGPPERAS